MQSFQAPKQREGSLAGYSDEHVGGEEPEVDEQALTDAVAGRQ